jgi:hypothetical protein
MQSEHFDNLPTVGKCSIKETMNERENFDLNVQRSLTVTASDIVKGRITMSRRKIDFSFQKNYFNINLMSKNVCLFLYCSRMFLFQAPFDNKKQCEIRLDHDHE